MAYGYGKKKPSKRREQIKTMLKNKKKKSK